MKSWRLVAVTLAMLIVGLRAFVSAQDVKKPLEKVRLTVPAKSLTFVPYYFGKSQRLYEKEGIDLELIVMRPPIGVTALGAEGRVPGRPRNGGVTIRMSGLEGRLQWRRHQLFKLRAKPPAVRKC